MPSFSSILVIIFVMVFNVYTHHRQVVVRFSTIAVLLYLGCHCLDSLAGFVGYFTTKNLQQTFFAEQLLFKILRLVQTVGIDKKDICL